MKPWLILAGLVFALLIVDALFYNGKYTRDIRRGFDRTMTSLIE